MNRSEITELLVKKGFPFTVEYNLYQWVTEWLRNEHKIHIMISLGKNFKYHPSITVFKDNVDYINFAIKDYDTYTDAIEDGIIYVLENLI